MEFQRAIILGAGSSSSTPFLTCVLGKKDCAACRDAMAHPKGRNHRLNPSFLLELRHPADGSIHHILIDCGKTFRETVLKTFSSLGVHDLSGVLLTHDHADAAFGIDDLRELNRRDKGCQGGVLDVYADARTLASMQRIFYYLFPAPDRSASPPPSSPPKPVDLTRQPWTAKLAWHCFLPDAVLEIPITCRNDSLARASWPVAPLPVLHGKAYHCNSFLMPMNDTRTRWLLYVSDVSRLEEDEAGALSFLARVCAARAALGEASARVALAASDTSCGEEARAVQHNSDHPLDLLILDLMSHNEYFSHFNTDESIAAAKHIGAKRTYFVGMSHSLEYHALTKLLAERGVGESMFVGYDGCVVADASALDKDEDRAETL